MHFDFGRIGRDGGCGVGAKKLQNVIFSFLSVTCLILNTLEVASSVQVELVLCQR